MNKVFRYTTIICGLVALFSVGNYFCYQSAINHFENMQTDYEERLGEQVEVYVNQEMEDHIADLEKKAEESVEVAKKETLLDEDTVFQIENYDAVTKTTTTDYETLPEKMIGYSVEDAEEYCGDYMNQMPVEDFLDGLQSIQVESFSPQRLVVRKTYDISKVKFRYYLIADEGEVVAYYGDMKTVYERTGIAVEDLSKHDKKELKKGIEVKDEEELFGILENYSS